MVYHLEIRRDLGLGFLLESWMVCRLGKAMEIL